VKIDSVQVAEPSFKFSDNRPIEMRKSRVDIDSSGVTTFFSDDNISPLPPAIVMAALQAQLSDKLAGHSVILNEFVMYVYEHKESVDANRLHTASASTPGSSPVTEAAAGMLIPSIDSVVGTKNVYLRISGKIDDQEFSTSVGDLYRGGVTEANLQATVKKTLKQLTNDVQSIVDKK
jgi:hypothetical protein